MSASWIDVGEDGPFAKHTLNKLISECLEPVDAWHAIQRTSHLIELLLLSNHVSHAYSLLTAVCKHGRNILRQGQTPSNHTWILNGLATLYNYWLRRRGFPPPDGVEADPRMDKQVQDGTWGWDQYRECNRTGWMLEHCSLPEPADVHIWRQTEAPAVLAMCARLLSKDKEPGQYPNQETLKEALEAGLKLYRQPQECITEWDWPRAREARKWRHSYLLYRRLMIEIAVRVNDLATAADVLSMALRLDGFNLIDGGSLRHFLMLPRIWDVVALTAERGAEGNPYFIDEATADFLVNEISAVLELRAEKGRQWSLAPEKVGWKELLDRLAQGAWKVNSKEYKMNGLRRAKDILYDPATEEEIAAAELKFGELPVDFKEMIRVANGFTGGYRFLSGGIAGIAYMRRDENDIIHDIEVDGMELDTDLNNMIVVMEAGADECDGYRHYMVLPAAWEANQEKLPKDKIYRYFNGAPWECGDGEYACIRDWVAELVEEVEGMVERGERKDDDVDVEEMSAEDDVDTEDEDGES